jgi:hypothetical protein
MGYDLKRYFKLVCNLQFHQNDNNPNDMSLKPSKIVFLLSILYSKHFQTSVIDNLFTKLLLQYIYQLYMRGSLVICSLKTSYIIKIHKEIIECYHSVSTSGQ